MKKTVALVTLLAVLALVASCGLKGSSSSSSGTTLFVPPQQPFKSLYNPDYNFPLGGYYLGPNASDYGFGAPSISALPVGGSQWNKTLDPRNWSQSLGVPAGDFTLYPLAPSGSKQGSAKTGSYLPRVPNFTLSAVAGTGSTSVTVGVVGAFEWKDASFYILYDSTKYDPTSVVNEGFLGPDGEVSYGATASQPGYVGVSISRYGSASPSTISGAGPLVTIVFTNQAYSVPLGAIRYLTGGPTS